MRAGSSSVDNKALCPVILIEFIWVNLKTLWKIDETLLRLNALNCGLRLVFR